MGLDPNNLSAGFLRAIHREPAQRPASYAEKPQKATEPEIHSTVPLESTKPVAGELLSFWVPIVLPKTTSQQKGAMATEGGGVRFFKKKKVSDAEKLISQALSPFRPPEPFCGPLSVMAKMILPWRKSENKGRMKTCREYPSETAPDIDNRWKMVGDQMTQLGFWLDDGQISSLTISKRYGDEPGVMVSISRDEPDYR